MRRFCVVFAVFLFIATPLHLNYASTDEISIYISKGNIFSNAFTEPFEKLYVVMKDGTVYSFTNHLENTVVVSLKTLKNILKKDGFEIADIVIVVHNHFARPRFSEADLTYYRHLKDQGFKGYFLLYIPAFKKVVIYEDK